MSEALDHDRDFNTHRLCIKDDLCHLPFFLQVNHTDLWYLQMVVQRLMPDAKGEYRAERERRANTRNRDSS